jgi:hypothetical protein
MKLPKLKYTSRPFPINEQNQAHWRLNLPHAQQCPLTTQYSSNDCADQELDVIIGNTQIASNDNELLENISHEYLQTVGLGKEIRYDLHSITVKFMLLQYKDQPIPIPSFTHSERAVLHDAIKEIIMAAELLRAVCAGNSADKYELLKTYIDQAHSITYLDKNCHRCKAPVGWLQRNIYKIHARMTNYTDIITFIDGRRDDVVKMAALQPYLSPYNELRKLERERELSEKTNGNTTNDPFYEESSLHCAPAGITLKVWDSLILEMLNGVYDHVTEFSYFIITYLVGDDYRSTIEQLFARAIHINSNN